GGTATIGGDLDFLSTGGGDCWLYFDNSSSLGGSGNALFSMQGGGQARRYLNENAGTTAVLNVTGDLTFDKQPGAGAVEFLQARSSQVNVGGDLNWTYRAGNDNSHYRLSN